MQLANWSFCPLQPYLILEFLVGLVVLFEGVGICPKKDRSGDEINDMPTALKPVVLLIEAKLNIPDATFEAIFVDDFTNSASKAEQKRVKFPFVVKEVYGEAEERGELAGRLHVEGDVNAAKGATEKLSYDAFVTIEGRETS
ncbi:hypothetical protein DER46DRAFT_566899 [Fusarium sp. MPI-SDFR-AT-0072]|nr:hypothetical protein DER46DRAFT_566899 [Fusarium sp. MPI-SDFR-AT-0072]